MLEQFSYDVFLSHSSKDKPVVRAAAERLRADSPVSPAPQPACLHASACDTRFAARAYEVKARWPEASLSPQGPIDPLHPIYAGRTIVVGKKKMSRRSDFEEVLKCQLDGARAEYEAAYKSFNVLIKDIPSEIPHPDGNLRIRQAGEASRAALQNYKHVLRQFTDYALSGTVPKDFLPPPD